MNKRTTYYRKNSLQLIGKSKHLLINMLSLFMCVPATILKHTAKNKHLLVNIVYLFMCRSLTTNKLFYL